jgi:hypothetical protein
VKLSVGDERLSSSILPFLRGFGHFYFWTFFGRDPFGSVGYTVRVLTAAAISFFSCSILSPFFSAAVLFFHFHAFTFHALFARIRSI